MPQWVQNAVIYHVFIDRFAGYTAPERAMEPVFIGGNVRGIIDKLPYIESLGVDVLWLSPFCKGDAYHGYHTTDFYAVDEHFGSEADLKELLALAHNRGLKVICDFVPNHVSRHHPFFLDATHNRGSNYKDWFIFERWPDVYQAFLSVSDLPKLNLDHGPAMEHVRGALRKWLALGFDGFRLDHIIGLSNQNVRDLIEPLRQEFPEAAFIGEAWFSGPKFTELKTLRTPRIRLLWMLRQLGFGSFVNDTLYKNYIGLLDGVLNFEGARLLEGYANAETAAKRKRFKAKIRDQATAYSSKLSLPVFLDNHDMERFLFRCSGDVVRLKKAARLQFSLNQPAIVYYGTEVGLSQSQPFNSRDHHADVLARQPMEWDAAKQNAELLAFYKAQIRQRAG